MRDNGLTIKRMDMEFIYILMEQGTKVNGITINSMVKVLKLGLMVRNM